MPAVGVTWLRWRGASRYGEVTHRHRRCVVPQVRLWDRQARSFRDVVVDDR